MSSVPADGNGITGGCGQGSGVGRGGNSGGEGAAGPVGGGNGGVGRKNGDSGGGDNASNNNNGQGDKTDINGNGGDDKRNNNGAPHGGGMQGDKSVVALAREAPMFLADVLRVAGSLRTLVACQAVCREWRRALGGDRGEELFGGIMRASGIPDELRPAVWQALVLRSTASSDRRGGGGGSGGTSGQGAFVCSFWACRTRRLLLCGSLSLVFSRLLKFVFHTRPRSLALAHTFTSMYPFPRETCPAFQYSMLLFYNPPPCLALPCLGQM